MSVDGFWLALGKTLFFFIMSKVPSGEKIVFFFVLSRIICFLLGHELHFPVHCTWPESLFFSWTGAQVAEGGGAKTTHGEVEGRIT